MDKLRNLILQARMRDVHFKDKFTHVHTDTDWKIGLSYAEELGIGTQSY